MARPWWCAPDRTERVQWVGCSWSGSFSAQGDELAKLKEQLTAETVAKTRAEVELNAMRIENARLDERGKAAESRGDELRQELGQLNSRLQELASQAKSGKPESSKKAKFDPES